LLCSRSHGTVMMLFPSLCITLLRALVAASWLLPFSLLMSSDSITPCMATAVDKEMLLPSTLRCCVLMMPLLCQRLAMLCSWCHCLHRNAVLMMPLLLLIVYCRHQLIVAIEINFLYSLDDGTPAAKSLNCDNAHAIALRHCTLRGNSCHNAAALILHLCAREATAVADSLLLLLPVNCCHLNIS